MALNRGWSWKASTRSIRPCTSSSLWPRWARRPLPRSMDLNAQEDYLGLKITLHSQIALHAGGFSLVSSSPAGFVFFSNIKFHCPGLWLPAAAPFWRLLWLPRLLGECKLPRHPPRRLVWKHSTQTAHSQRSEVTTLCAPWKTKEQTEFSVKLECTRTSFISISHVKSSPLNE